MHRVVQFSANGKDEEKTKGIKTAIINKLASYDRRNIYDKQVNDGHYSANSTIGANIRFVIATDANNFNNWLKDFIEKNVTDINEARGIIHDCSHFDDVNVPCMIGDMWEV